ncbi:intramembrane metalloprotease PrsW [Paenibacillus sp. F411]|uniref:glutamic-type intramembrane protease PrsW n=1 Tax=Paenibacillus sp. F411 TaxID=2820239 RepID=UPI001AAF7D51|nr:intramembrane metalloprotease PrsW [Paenibacillus sp. F411]
MLVFTILASALAPGLSLLTYFYLKDKYDQEPLHMVLRMFLFGFLIVIPVLIIQKGMLNWFGGIMFIEPVFISGGVEEFLKWFVLFHLIYNHIEFDEPYDSILYSAAISLGFASAENILYAWYSQGAFAPMMIRAMLPVSGHAMFGVIMGYYLGRAKFSKGSLSRRFLLMSLLIPWAYHALYDLILNTFKNSWLWFIVPMMVLLWYGAMGKIARANNRSPFRMIHKDEEVKT